MPCLCSLCSSSFTDPATYKSHGCFRDEDGTATENVQREGMNGELLHRHVLSYWEAEGQWYKGTFSKFDEETKSYSVRKDGNQQVTLLWLMCASAFQ